VSHYRLLERVVALGRPAVILEDDAHIRPSIRDVRSPSNVSGGTSGAAAPGGAAPAASGSGPAGSPPAAAAGAAAADAAAAAAAGGPGRGAQDGDGWYGQLLSALQELPEVSSDDLTPHRLRCCTSITSVYLPIASLPAVSTAEQAPVQVPRGLCPCLPAGIRPLNKYAASANHRSLGPAMHHPTLLAPPARIGTCST
jgi:hypothetical protein